jgi:membrane complex biogenesis BtpA family protein
VALPLGINVLRNDGLAALAIAHAVGASFVRINILCGAALTDQGIIEGRAAEILRERARLGATESIWILADAAVKHAAPLAARPLAEEIGDLIERGLADGVIISGSRTGAAADPSRVAEARSAARGTPIYVGSGVTAANAALLLRTADGLIVGTSLKEGADVRSPVCIDRAKEIVAAVKGMKEK